MRVSFVFAVWTSFLVNLLAQNKAKFGLDNKKKYLTLESFSMYCLKNEIEIQFPWRTTRMQTASPAVIKLLH
jgi:hypothetical protein